MLDTGCLILDAGRRMIGGARLSVHGARERLSGLRLKEKGQRKKDIALRHKIEAKLPTSCLLDSGLCPLLSVLRHLRRATVYLNIENWLIVSVRSCLKGFIVICKPFADKFELTKI